MEHSDFSTRLGRAYRERTGVKRSGVRLPSDKYISIGGDLSRATLHLTRTAVVANMQTDAGAFDGWALVLMVWCGVERVVVDWETPEDAPGTPAARHYQRFLYRLDRLSELLGEDRLGVEGRERLGALRVRDGGRATLNVADGKDTSVIASPLGSEAALEKLFTTAGSEPRQRLMERLGLTALDRQFPVGVYDGEPMRGGDIFAGGKSAIDLVGAGLDGAFWLLELKAEGNIQVGALSELFFYSMVICDAWRGRIALSARKPGERASVRPADLMAAKGIKARLLAGRHHPLLSGPVFATLNEGAERLGLPVNYGSLDIRPLLEGSAAGLA